MSKIAEGKWIFLSLLLDATVYLKVYCLIQWQGDSHISKKQVVILFLALTLNSVVWIFPWLERECAYGWVCVKMPFWIGSYVHAGRLCCMSNKVCGRMCYVLKHIWQTYWSHSAEIQHTLSLGGSNIWSGYLGLTWDSWQSLWLNRLAFFGSRI